MSLLQKRERNLHKKGKKGLKKLHSNGFIQWYRDNDIQGTLKERFDKWMYERNIRW